MELKRKVRSLLPQNPSLLQLLEDIALEARLLLSAGHGLVALDMAIALFETKQNTLISVRFCVYSGLNRLPWHDFIFDFSLDSDR